MAKRNAAGAGSIRKKTVLRDGREYTYWEARLTVGVDPGTGKQIRRSFSGKTQKEVREEMQSAAVAVNDSTYQEPTKLTVSDWLDVWLSEYTGDVKPLTRSTYKNKVESAIKPALGAVKLQALKAPQIQKMLNDLQRGTSGRKPLSAKRFGIFTAFCTGRWDRPSRSAICGSILPMPVSCRAWSGQRSSRWTKHRPPPS